MSEIELCDHFTRYFEARPAIDEASRRQVFRLRYAVYCEELGYENAAAFPEHEESDSFDERSTFALLVHRASDRAAGCVRLVHDEDAPLAQMPFEAICGSRIDGSRFDLGTLDRRRLGEISRLAIHRDFRRRRGESEGPEGAVDAAAHFGGERRYPLLAMSLFLSAAALGLHRGLDRVVVLMEPRLARLLEICGIHFVQIGGTVEFHGIRAPYSITRRQLLETLPGPSRRLLDLLSSTLASHT